MAVNLMGDVHQVFKFKGFDDVDQQLALMDEVLDYVRELRGIQEREVLDIRYDDSDDNLYAYNIVLAPQSREEFEAYLERLRAQRS